MSVSGMLSESPRRAVAIRLLAVTGTIGVGLGLQQLLATRLEAIEALARDDVIAARAELAGLLRVVAVLVFGATAGVGVSMLLACRRALETERFPPPGAWSWGAVRIATGPRARRLARVGMALGVALVGLSAAGGGLMWMLGARLLACHSGAG